MYSLFYAVEPSGLHFTSASDDPVLRHGWDGMLTNFACL
jgi:hypothetical protein